MVVIYDALFEIGVWQDMDTLPESYTYLTNSPEDLAIIAQIQPIIVDLIGKAALGMDDGDMKSAMLSIAEDGKPENADKPNNKAQALTVTLIDFVRLNLLKAYRQFVFKEERAEALDDWMQQALDQLLTYAWAHQDQTEFALIIELSHQYPNDIGLFCVLLLNLITLKPGEAMYLNANTPHAYVKGTGLEIMANSDNVLRAGLTPKHIDVAELVACTEFNPIPFNRLLLAPSKLGQCDSYAIPVSDFSFNIFHCPKQEKVTTSGAEILMAIDNDLTLMSQNGEHVTLTKGQSVFIPAYIGHYELSSEGRVARAFN